MIEQRSKGCFIFFTAVMLLANTGLFLGYLFLEKRYQFFGLHWERSLYLYVLAIPLAYYQTLPHLRQVFQRLHSPSRQLAMVTSFRFQFIQTIVWIVIYFILQDIQTSRLFIVGYIPLSFTMNWILVHKAPSLISRLVFRQKGSLNAIVYGHGEIPDDLRAYIRRAASMGVHFVGYYADQPMGLHGIEWLGKTDELMTCEGGRKRLRAQLVFAYTDHVLEPRFKESVDLCIRKGARVNIYSNLSKAFIDPIRIVSDGNMHFLTFHDEPLQNPVNLAIKRVIDIAIALPVVVFILPPLTLMVWICQKRQSPGPLFFKQTRYGINRQPFTILKFRTMHVGDRSLEAKQATKGDPRIYPLGAFLRKTSLDEFPQFMNALRGDMSVVGPRPHLTLHDDQFEKHFRRYRSRHYVKPGITGLAQVSGYRGETIREEDIIGRVQHDLIYITSWSVGQELLIILKTAWQVVSPPKGAY